MQVKNLSKLDYYKSRNIEKVYQTERVFVPFIEIHLPSLTFLYEKADFFSFSVVFQTIF